MLTVAFASHNGARTLPRMLEALTEVIPPAGGWKLLAVDNASTDATARILERYRSRLPLERLHHDEPGKNAALNAALPALEGELAVFTDDDVLPAPDWLTALEDGARRYPGHDLFGGRITLEWPAPPPEWLTRHVNLAIAYARTDPAWPEGDIRADLIWGPNMMIRRRVFAAGHRFSEAIGPRAGGSYIMGSETELTTRLAEAGYRACHLPAARVAHIVRPEQMERRWILERASRFGRSLALADATDPQARQAPRLLGAPRWLYRALLRRRLEAVAKGGPLRTGASIAPLWQAHVLKGQIAEGRRLQRRGP